MARKQADSTNEGHTGLDWGGVRRAFADWKTYVMAVAYTCEPWHRLRDCQTLTCAGMNTNLASVGGFLPTIVKGLGYTNAEVGEEGHGSDF